MISRVVFPVFLVSAFVFPKQGFVTDLTSYFVTCFAGCQGGRNKEIGISGWWR